MAGRTKYSDSDKARVANALALNEGNVKRTARETGVPENTVRDWKNAWAKDGVPATIEQMQSAELDQYVERTSRVRDLALARLEEVIPDTKSARELATTFGILDDKLTRARGLPTSRQETVGLSISMSPDALGIALSAWAEKAAVESAQRREDIIEVEAEVVEQA